MPYVSVTWWVIGISELVAVVLVVRIWRSNEFLFLRILLSLVAFAPVIGPIVVLWVSRFPEVAPDVMQNRGKRGDYYLDWSRVLGARTPIQRFRRWRAQVGSDEKSNP